MQDFTLRGLLGRIQRKRNIILFFLILAIGVFLRMYHLNFQSFWVDEIHTMDTVNPERSLGSLIENCKADQPPAYFIILYYWLKLFLYSEFYARLLSVILGAAGIVAVYFLGREVKNEEVGLIASFITSINFYHIAYSQEARFYGLLFLASALSYLFFIRSFVWRKNSDFILYCIFTTLLLYTHYYGLVVFATQGIIFIFVAAAFKLPRPVLLKAIGCGIICLSFFAPWIPQVMHDNALNSFWIPPVSPEFILRYFYGYFNKDVLTSILFASLILLYVKSAMTSFRFHTRNENTIMIVVLVWIVFSYGIPLIYSIVRIPMLIERYTMIALPAIFIIIASAIWSLKKHKVRLILLLIVLVSTFSNFMFVHPYFSVTRKQQLREISAEVSQIKCMNCIYVSDMTWYFDYYLRRFHINRPSLDVSKLSVEKIDGMDSVWLLAGTHEFLTNPAKPEALTKQYYLSYEITGKYALGRLYTKHKPHNITRKNMVIE